jgi:hypothetical protein
MKEQRKQALERDGGRGGARGQQRRQARHVSGSEQNKRRGAATWRVCQETPATSSEMGETRPAPWEREEGPGRENRTLEELRWAQTPGHCGSLKMKMGTHVDKGAGAVMR